MLGAFKDLFGKKATDLNKKEFYDGKGPYVYKLTSKTADGVSFEGNLKSGADAVASDINLNFKDKEMEVKNKLDHKSVFTVESNMFSVADGIDAGLKFVTPEAAASDNTALFETVSGSTTYKAKDLSAKGELVLKFDKDSTICPNFKDWSANAELCAKVMDDITAGLSITGLSLKGTAVSGGCDLGGIYKCGDLELAGHFVGNLTDNVPAPDKLSASVWNQATKETAVACEFELNKDSDVTIKLGSQFKMTDLSTFKTKLTLAKSKPSLDFAWIHKFEGKTLTLNHNFVDGGNSKFGIGLTIDA